jgi:hypothetical protein
LIGGVDRMISWISTAWLIWYQFKSLFYNAPIPTA